MWDFCGAHCSPLSKFVHSFFILIPYLYGKISFMAFLKVIFGALFHCPQKTYNLKRGRPSVGGEWAYHIPLWERESREGNCRAVVVGDLQESRRGSFLFVWWHPLQIVGVGEKRRSRCCCCCWGRGVTPLHHTTGTNVVPVVWCL